MTNLYFLIAAVIAQIFNPTTEFVMPAGTPTNKGKRQTETDPVITERKTKNAYSNSKAYKTFSLFTQKIIVFYFF